MKIDNFNRINTLLKEDDPEYFYAVQILRRGKDHPELPAANWCVKSICINGKDSLYKHTDEIIKLCQVFEARAYISLMRKSNRKCIENAIMCYAERLYNGDNKKPEAIWWHAVGTTNPEERIWVIDVDISDWNKVQEIKTYIENRRPNKSIISIVPTINGYHIICHPFDCSTFIQDIGKDAEIKKHGLTLLYA